MSSSSRWAPESPFRLLRIALTGLVLASVLAAGCAGPSASSTADENAVVFPLGPDLGTAAAVDPAASAVLKTAKWGVVADGQLGIVVAGDADGAKVAAAVAAAVGGEIAGEVAFVRLYQIAFPPSGEAGLSAALGKAAAVPGVESAFVNQAVYPDIKVTGVACSPVKDDKAYAGDNARPYEMIGVEKAWAIIRGSGLDLNPVQVGITDDGLYRNQGEFDGDSPFETAEGDDELGNNRAAEDARYGTIGSHGTAVAGIIGANPDDGGQAGVASVLGKKMKVSMTNVFKGKYSKNTTAVADPNDPTKYTNASGSWALSDLVALTEQIKRGSTVINCSWGNSNADPAIAAAYKRFFTQMATDHPKVLFVCSAGNDGAALDGTKRFPSGLDLPNMITVGCLDNDGSRVDYSNKSSGNFNVDISAPGHRVVSGVGPDGKVDALDGGTSFATPQVTSAAAMLRSLNPGLSASEIKEILLDTGTNSFTDPATGAVTRVPADVGGACVAVDRAVLKVVNNLRTKKGLAPLTMDDIEKMSRIDLVAEGEGTEEWTVTAGLPGGDGADAVLRLVGDGKVDGDPAQSLASGGKAEWAITPKGGSAIAHVKRSDTGSCWRVTLGMQPFQLTEGDMTILGDPAIGELGVQRAFKALTIRVKPKAGSASEWEVTGLGKATFDGIKKNRQTFYGPVQVKVTGTFDQETGELKAHFLVQQKGRYERMTGYDNTPRKGDWNDRFDGDIEIPVTQDAETVQMTIPGEHTGGYRSQRDDKSWSEGSSDRPWTYTATFKKQPL